MLFQKDIVIPASTTEADPVIETLKIAKGIISKIMIRPRAGHRYLAHLTVRYHESQIAPSTEKMDLAGDFFPIDWEEYYEVYQPPFELKLTGWNDDDTFSHTFTVYVVILPRKAILPLAIVDSISSLFSFLNPVRIFTQGEEGQ